MLRVAFRCTTRPRLLQILQHSRLQRTSSSRPSSSSSSPPPKETGEFTPKERVTLEHSNEPEIPEEIADVLEAKPEHVTPTVANTSAEMFGNSDRFNHRALGLKHDPTLLPLERDLEPWKTAFSEEEYAMTLVHGRSVHEPFFHPRTHDIPVANIHFRSHHIELLSLFTHFALHAASSLGIPTSGVASLPTKRTLWTVPRSPFAHKKSQENFERKVHKRAIKAWDADAEVVQRWVAYLRTHALAGVGMKVTTWDRVPIGIGKAKILFPDDDDDTNPMLVAPEAIKELGSQIIQEETAAAEKANHLP